MKLEHNARHHQRAKREVDQHVMLAQFASLAIHTRAKAVTTFDYKIQNRVRTCLPARSKIKGQTKQSKIVGVKNAVAES